jgi:uncharacterized protein (DUF1501 family)
MDHTMPTAEDSYLPRHRILTAQAATVEQDRCNQDALWNKGFTRRRFLAGAGMVSVAALGSQLVTTKVAYAATGTSNGNTLITVFLRGAADGLRILVPATAALGMNYLQQVRPALVPAPANLTALSGTGGWALNSAMSALMPFWNSGELSFVPAVSDPSLTRSHFQAQQAIERGGSASATSGWLDRGLQQLGPGTTFRAVAEGGALPASLGGDEVSLAMNSLKSFTFPGWADVAAQSETAINGLYRGLSGPLAEDVPMTISALATAATAQAAAGVQNGAVYPSGSFAASMQDLATMVRAGVGLQVATVDVGGWDTHTNEANELDGSLTSAANTLAAFMTDLGPALRSKVTVVVMTEFGRRVAMNASGGTDHGHGSVSWLLGGGIKGGAVHGSWQQLSDTTLDQGDVQGLNNPFDILSELAQKRLGIGSLANLFPGHTYSEIGVARAS